MNYAPTSTTHNGMPVEIIQYDGTPECEKSIHDWMEREALKPGNPFFIDGVLTIKTGDLVCKSPEGIFFRKSPSGG